MPRSPTLSGLYIPLITPFDADGTVALTAMSQLAADYLNDGATGIVVLGTTGEPTALGDSEHDAVVAACAQVCADRDAECIVGAGTNSTRTTIARHEALAEPPGVTAALTVVPYYVRPSEAAIVTHFQTVAARSPVPLVVYNIPYRTGRALGATALLELAATDNIVGLKQAVGGIDTDTLTVLADPRPDFAVLGGDDPYLFPMTLMGASGAVAAAAHLCTEGFAAMIADGLGGRVEEGRRRAERLLPLVKALFAEPSPAVMKALLYADGRIPTPDVRMPLANASAAAVQDALAIRERSWVDPA